MCVERKQGIEPWSLPWRGSALPLCYNRVSAEAPLCDAYPSSGSNGEPPGLQPGALPSELDGPAHSLVDLRGFEPWTSAMPRRCAPTALQAHRPGPENRTRYVLLPKQAGQPAPSPRMRQPRRPYAGTPAAGKHAIHCGRVKEQLVRKGDRIRTRNIRCWKPALWTVELHP